MNILALDLSLTGTGVCKPDGDCLTLATKHKGLQRLAWLRSMIGFTLALGVDLAVVEGYSFNSKGNSAVSLGELGGVIRMLFWDREIPHVEIPPACRAKYATGKGNAGKDAVLQQAVLRSGGVFEDNNAADAWWLWQMALAHYEPASPLLVKMPAGNREALLKVAWVDVERRAA